MGPHERKVVVALAGLALLAEACGSSGEKAPKDCGLSMPAGGGHEAKLTADACGVSLDALSFSDWSDGPEEVGTTVELTFHDGPPKGTEGFMDLRSILVRTDDQLGRGEIREWETPERACSVVISSNERTKEEDLGEVYWVAGKGTATAPPSRPPATTSIP